jgi:hypothetical protein
VDGEFLHVSSLIFVFVFRSVLRLSELTNVHKVTMNGRRCGHGWANQVRAAASALTAFKVTVAGAGASLARFESVGIHGQAHRATGFAPFKTSCFEDLVKALALRLFFDQARAGHDHGQFDSF